MLLLGLVLIYSGISQLVLDTTLEYLLLVLLWQLLDELGLDLMGDLLSIRMLMLDKVGLWPGLGHEEGILCGLWWRWLSHSAKLIVHTLLLGEEWPVLLLLGLQLLGIILLLGLQLLRVLDGSIELLLDVVLLWISAEELILLTVRLVGVLVAQIEAMMALLMLLDISQNVCLLDRCQQLTTSGELFHWCVLKRQKEKKKKEKDQF